MSDTSDMMQPVRKATSHRALFHLDSRFRGIEAFPAPSLCRSALLAHMSPLAVTLVGLRISTWQRAKDEASTGKLFRILKDHGSW